MFSPWRALGTAGVAFIAIVAAPDAAHAQTDYFNTDGGRPLRVQDALSVEWRAIELQFAPLRFERHRNNRWRVEVEPELAFGILPRTHLSIGFPLASADRPAIPIPVIDGLSANSRSAQPSIGGSGIAMTGLGATSRAAALATPPTRDVVGGTGALPGNGQVNGLAGLHLSLFHQLNVETRIPALAVRGEVLLPVGPLAPDRAYPSLTAIATRTLPALGPVRLHGNATVTFGAAPNVGASAPTSELAVAEVPRWMAGVSMDRAFPLHSTLIAAEVVARRSMLEGDDMVLSAGAGVRHQFSPRLVLDVGVGRELSGPDAHWSFTVGSAIALGLGRRLF